MAKDAARLRDKALRLGRKAFENLEAKRYPQVAAAAGRVETILFRLICGDPHDLGLCSAFGEIASAHLRTHSETGTRVKSFAYVPVALARAALWARDRADPSEGMPEDVERAVREPAAESTFPSFSGGVRDLSPQTRVTDAADARLQLALVLARHQPGRDSSALTAGQLDLTLRSREKFFRSDEELLYHFHTTSGMLAGATAEAEALAREAVMTYRFVALHLGSWYEQDVIRAEAAQQAIHRLTP